MTRVVVCATSPVTRGRLATKLRGERLDVLAEIETLSELDEHIAAARPDVVVLALDSHEEDEWTSRLEEELAELTDGRAAAPDSRDAAHREALRTGHAAPPIVALTERLGDRSFNTALRAGISALLPLDATGAEIAAAISAASAGLVVFDPQMIAVLERSRVSGTPTDTSNEEDFDEQIEALTPREIDVLRMLARGQSNREIAARLKISEHTVKFHTGSIFGKLNASNRTEAVMLGIRRGLIAV